MSRKNKDRKVREEALREARRITPGKLFRLLLKSLLFALVVAVLFTIWAVNQWPGYDQWWLQLALMVGVYVLAYRFLMSEFRPKAPSNKR
ncbi:MAG: hypothetical protein KGZ60_00645 [Truepera sp.]|nr:hypothetical protein [Truepera sp.]